MIRKALVMGVNAGAEEEYERRHRPIWPELERVLLEHGVRTYSIFLHEETRQLFAYVEFRSEAEWRAIAETEVCRRWWKYMREIMPANADDSPVAVEMQEVFHLCADEAGG
jgi:L-rhamnose mutarotase